MTICNMSIESGARGGMIAPDETTFNYLKGRNFLQKAKSGIKLFYIGRLYHLTPELNMTKKYILTDLISNQ